MRRPWSLLLATFLAAQTAAAAQVVAVPPSAGVSAVGGAAASVTAAPMVQYGALQKGDIRSALAFVNDPVLQEWLWASRPAKAEATLTLARRLADFGEVARAYATDADAMRWALLMRQDEAMIQRPGSAEAIFGSNDFLSGSYETARQAYCAWSVLDEAERATLTERGHDAAAWRGYELKQRVAVLREIWIAKLNEKIPESALDPRYAPTLRAFLRRAGGYLNKEEFSTIARDAERAERLAARVAESRDRAARQGDLETLRGLNRVAQSGDVDEARAEFDRVFVGAGGDPSRTEIPPTIHPALLERIAAELPAAVRRLAEGTPAAAVLDEASAGRPLKVEYDAMSPGQIAFYQPGADRLVFNPADLMEFLRSEGRAPETMDRALFERYALAIAPVFAHEATHARQFRKLARRGFTAKDRFYQHAMEVEAFAVQGALARAIVARSPQAREAISAMTARPELRALTLGWRINEHVVTDVRGRYRTVGGTHHAWGTAFSGARARALALRRFAPAAREELARRGRLPGAERAAFEKTATDKGAVQQVKTSVLRRLLLYGAEGSRAVVEAVTAANDEIMNDARTALAAFHALRPAAAAPQR